MAGPRWRSIALGLAGLAFTAIFVRAGISFRAQFPWSYSWSELLLNYQGGFVRRGLLGEIAIRLDWLVPARDLISVVLVLLYAAVAVWLLILMARMHMTLPGMLFITSPATILFPVYDLDAFGRKDIFILAAFASATLVISRVARNQAMFWLMVIYMIAGLIVESARFYFPLAISLLTVSRGAEAPSRWHGAIWATAGAYLLACFGLTYLTNAGHQQSAIVQSWQAIYPDAFRDVSPVTWLGLSLRDGIAMTFGHLSNPMTAISYVLAFILANVPLLLLLCDTRRRPTATVAGIAAGGALFMLLLMFVLGADWGRYIYLFTIHAFVFAALTRVSVSSLKERLPVVAAVCLVALYALTWQVKHFRSGGKSAFVPGVIFQFNSQGPLFTRPPETRPSGSGPA